MGKVLRKKYVHLFGEWCAHIFGARTILVRCEMVQTACVFNWGVWLAAGILCALFWRFFWR